MALQAPTVAPRPKAQYFAKGPRARMEDFVIVPEQNVWVMTWDLFVVVVVFATAYYEPYAVAVLHDDPRWAIVLNYFLDAVFSVDMALQFFVAYARPVESSAGRSLWETDPGKIRARYCGVPFSQGAQAGWFWIDMLAVMPGAMSLMQSVVPSTSEHSHAAKLLVLLRVLRLLRIAKLVRLAKYFEKWHALFGFPFYVVELSKFAIITTLTCHWLACVWVVVEGRVSGGKVSYKTEKETWLSALIKAKGDTCTPSAAEDPGCVYVIAVYWSMMTLTTVGYGDVIPQNPVEYVVCTISMIIVAYVWAFIVAKFVTILEAINSHEQAFRQRADDLQRMMDNRSLPQRVQRHLRAFLHGSKATTMQAQQQGLLRECISEGLQREIAMCSGVFEDFRRGVYWAQDLQQDALLDLVRALYPVSFAPQEIMRLHQVLLIMRGGFAASLGRILTRGDVWGQHDILLETPALTGTAQPRSLSYVDVVCLDKASLVEVCKSFPHADRRIRRAQIRTAVFRAFVLAARVELGVGTPLESYHDRDKQDADDALLSDTVPNGRFKSTAASMDVFTASQSTASQGRASTTDMCRTASEAPRREPIDDDPSRKRGRSAVYMKRSAVTSLVSPGESRLSMPAMVRQDKADKGQELADVVKLLETLAAKQDALEDKVGHINQAVGGFLDKKK